MFKSKFNIVALTAVPGLLLAGSIYHASADSLSKKDIAPPLTSSEAVILDRTFLKPAGDSISTCTNDGLKLYARFHLSGLKTEITNSLRHNRTEHFQRIDHRIKKLKSAFAKTIIQIPSSELRTEKGMRKMMNKVLNEVKSADITEKKQAPHLKTLVNFVAQGLVYREKGECNLTPA